MRKRRSCINTNEGFVQDLKDVWRRFGQQYLDFEIKFDTDQDVLNFVKDYARTIKDPKKINKAIVAIIAKGAEGVGKGVTKATRYTQKKLKKYPKTASAVGGAIAFDIFDDA